MNYSAWELNPTDFFQATTQVQQAQFLISYAVLAPNSHNTQPWHFRIGNGGWGIEIYPDHSRSIPCSDPHSRQFYLSLVCALGNLLVAAAYFGFDAEVSYHLNASAQEPRIGVLLQKRKGRPSPTVQNRAALLPFITQRRMNRAPYTARPVDQKIVSALQAYNDEETVTVSFIEKESTLFCRFLAFVHQGTVATQSNPGIIEEWKRWFRPVNTPEYDGVPPFDFSVPQTVTSVVEQAQETQTLFSTAPIFLVIGAMIDDVERWVRAGKVLAYMSLAAEKNGVSQAPWGAVVEDAISAHQASQLLGIPHTLYFSRLGYAETIPHHSPRRSVHEVLV